MGYQTYPKPTQKRHSQIKIWFKFHYRWVLSTANISAGRLDYYKSIKLVTILYIHHTGSACWRVASCSESRSHTTRVACCGRLSTLHYIYWLVTDTTCAFCKAKVLETCSIQISISPDTSLELPVGAASCRQFQLWLFSSTHTLVRKYSLVWIKTECLRRMKNTYQHFKM